MADEEVVAPDYSQVFIGLGITQDEALASLRSAQRHRRNPGVCVCGHAATAHTENVKPGVSAAHDAVRDAGHRTCAPSKHVCPCPGYVEALKTQDTRRFRYATRGPGGDHALMMGIMSAMTHGMSVDWNPDVCCSKCEASRMTAGVSLTIIAYDKLWRESKTATDFNVFMCNTCREEVYRTMAGVPGVARS